MSSKRKRVRDKWRSKSWYTVMSPPYFGGVDLGALPSDSKEKLVGRVVDVTLYDITNDFTQMNIKIYFQITDVEGKTAQTVFKGHEYSRDYLRSLVRRRTTSVDMILDVTTKDDHRMRLAVSAFTLSRIRTTQEQTIRGLMKEIVEEKAKVLTFNQFVQEMVLGKIASDIYKEAKKVAPLRHMGIRKSKLILKPKATT